MKKLIGFIVVSAVAAVLLSGSASFAQRTVKNYFEGCSGAYCDNVLNINGTLKVNGSAVNVVGGTATGKKIAAGQQTTVAAADTIATGLATVTACTATYETDPGDANTFVSCQVGDQNGSPVAGSIIIKTWKSADGADVTPSAATAFSKKVNWTAVGS